jgi:ATP-binding cassette subfamily B protein
LVLAKKCVKYSHIHGVTRTNLIGKIIDSLTNNFTANLYTAFNSEMKLISDAQQIEKRRNYQALFYMAIMLMLLSIVDLIGGFLTNGFTFYSWMHGEVSTGTIIQIFATTLNMMFIIWFSGVLIPQFFQSLGIMNQAYSVMLDPQDITDIPDAAPLSISKGEIILRNVTFNYGDKLFFEDLNLHIAGGEKVGLVGYSGAGKSTLVKLIMRFYQLNKGEITIDGQNINEVTLESLRKQVSLIPQDPLLFHRTFEENIHYGRLDASTEEVIQAAKLAHCHEFILKSPNGYDSLVGERGEKLSGGERQRIAIARAILANAPILILDEATSSLDTLTEKFIQESIEKLIENRTSIVIAHRLSTLSKMNRIIVFEHGKIVEMGTHNELMKKNGHYAHMWKTQAGGFLPENPDN